MIDEKTKRQEILTKKLVMPADYVLIAGCGGSGFNIGMLLGMAGVKKFILIDHDFLDESNRNRILSKPSDVSRSKVEILRDLLMDQGAESVIIYKEMATYSLLEIIATIEKVSVIVSCVDTFAAISFINDFCKEKKIRMIRAGSDDDKISIATQMGTLLDLDGQDGYQTYPNWAGSTMMSSVLASYLVLYPDIDIPVTTINVFDLLKKEN